jgi:hypothetical protein
MNKLIINIVKVRVKLNEHNNIIGIATNNNRYLPENPSKILTTATIGISNRKKNKTDLTLIDNVLLLSDSKKKFKSVLLIQSLKR